MHSSRSILIIGPFPPPYGGVSVHVARLAARLVSGGWRVLVVSQPHDGAPPPFVCPSPSGSSWKRFVLTPRLWWRAGIVHCHDGWGWSCAMILMCFFGKAVVMSMHDQQTADKLVRAGAPQQACARVLCRLRSVSWIAVSEVVREQLVSLGVRGSRIRVVAAHLEPLSTAPFSDLPLSLQSFIKVHSPVMSVYGWRLVVDDKGRDLYGFTEAVDSTAELAKDTPDLGLVICVPQPDDEGRLQALRQQIASRGLTSRVHLQLVPLPDATALWAASDIFLRPTTTDGDSVAVREALGVGTAVVASDSAPRPSGVVVYSGVDRGALANTVRAVLREGVLRDSGDGALQESAHTRFAQIEETYLEAVAGRRRRWRSALTCRARVWLG